MGVTGQIYAASYTSPTPSKMTTAISDMETAYTDAAGRVNPDELDLGAGIIQGMTLKPGLYKWGSNVGFTSSLTFDGAADGKVWILQMTGDLIVGAGAIVTLKNGAKAENIFWQVAGSTTLHTTAEMKGTILCATAIDFQTGSSLNGKALAQTAVTLDAATIVTKVARRQLDENPLQVVDLGTAGDFVVLTKSGVTTTGVTKVTGNMGTSPIAAAALTGFDLIMDSSNTHSTSKLVTGQIFAAGRVNPDELDLGAGIIEGQTLAPGLYKWGSNVGFTSSLTFDGDAVAGKDPVWILQMTGDLIVGAGA